MKFPEELRYTREHEWARLDDDKKVATVGITDYAQDKLGDIVFVELPEEGAEVNREETFGSVESVKAVSDLFAPLSGVVVEVNDALPDSPEAMNDDPYGEAWMIRIQLTDSGEFTGLMSAEDYKHFLAAQEEEEG